MAVQGQAPVKRTDIPQSLETLYWLASSVSVRVILRMQLTLLLAVSALQAQEASVTARNAAVSPAAAPAGRVVASGISRQTTLQPPRISGAIGEATVDGQLDEPVWQHAALLTGFSQFQPADGRPADDSTEVLIWYSPTAIYF